MVVIDKKILDELTASTSLRQAALGKKVLLSAELRFKGILPVVIKAHVQRTLKKLLLQQMNQKSNGSFGSSAGSRLP